LNFLFAGWLTGGLCAVSSGLVVVGSGLHSDIPYLLLFVAVLEWPQNAVAAKRGAQHCWVAHTRDG
jgi:hypothetical protein